MAISITETKLISTRRDGQVAGIQVGGVGSGAPGANGTSGTSGSSGSSGSSGGISGVTDQHLYYEDEVLYTSGFTANGESEFNGNVDFNSSYRIPYSGVSTNVTLDDYHSLVIVNSGCTITLPTSSGRSGQQYTIKSRTDEDITINVSGGEYIDDDTELIITNKNNSPRLISDGTRWLII